MKFGPVPVDDAEGKILGHNITGLDGRRLLRKGRPLSAADIHDLQELGRNVIYIAELEAGDATEDEAAGRIAQAVSGPGLRRTGSTAGRVNMVGEARGVLRVDVPRLTTVNRLEGVTLATLAANTVVQPRQMVATVKIIPYAIPTSDVIEVEASAERGGPIIRLDELQPRQASLILSGSPAARERVEAAFPPPLEARLKALGSEISSVDFISLEDDGGEARLAGALRQLVADGTDLVILAGETAIMDPADIAPRAVSRAGGQIVSVGVPVDPGNLLMLAYLEGVAILGAPGCARSRKTNVIDWILPRLLVGERLTKEDLDALANGGLLEDVPERPMPRVQEE
jgi:hypothetical protein